MRKEIEIKLERDLSVINEVMLPPLALSIWDVDEIKIQSVLDNLLKIQFVNAVELEREGFDKIKKEKSINPYILKKFDIYNLEVDKDKKLGVISLFIDKSFVEEQLLNVIISILLSSLLMVGLIAVSIYVLINKILIKNIIFTSHYLS